MGIFCEADVEYKSGIRWDSVDVVCSAESNRTARYDDVSYTGCYVKTLTFQHGRFAHLLLQICLFFLRLPTLPGVFLCFFYLLLDHPHINRYLLTKKDQYILLCCVAI